MSMNEDIKKYPVYVFMKNNLFRAKGVKSTDDYNHQVLQMHHYIKKQDWERNKEWYQERGIEQKLILLPIVMHEQVHYQAIKNMNDKEFSNKYGIRRSDLLYSRKNQE